MVVMGKWKMWSIGSRVTVTMVVLLLLSPTAHTGSGAFSKSSNPDPNYVSNQS